MNPAATGSRVVTMTMGIVLVACLAARIDWFGSNDKHIDLLLHQLRQRASGI